MGLRYDEHRCPMVFTSGLAGAFLYMHLAATTLGLASQWVSAIATPFASCMAKDLLGIPHGMQTYDMMALGYPAIQSSDKFMRDQEKMIHHDNCEPKDFRSDDEVKDFVKRARNWTIGAHRRK
jgi:nitroreductase